MKLKTAFSADVGSERPLYFACRILKVCAAVLLCMPNLGLAQRPPSEIFSGSLPPGAVPRIHGPRIYGVRPWHPFLFRIPTTGERPLKFSAKDLPAELTLDASAGIISGRAPARGTYTVLLTAENSHGGDTQPLRIVVGDTLALTPPMGWSSWYMAHTDVSDELIRKQADALVSSGLADHGYSFVNIDDGWNRNARSNDPMVKGAARDEEGALRPNEMFPNMIALTGYIHSKGLKAGIYISPGPRTCAGYEGSYGHEQQDAELFAAWGFDFLKYDFCSYDELIKGSRRREDLIRPYRLMGSILKSLDRDMVFNLCQYGLGDVWEWGREVGGNFWRTSDDVGSGIDGSLWKSTDAFGFGEAGKEQWAGPGGWNDPDNILIGQILWHDKLRPTPLTPDEQYTWITLWSMLNAPLILGNDLTKLDAFTLSLLSNDEVIAVNQDALGRQAVRVLKMGSVEVWEKNLEDGSKAIAFFNRGPSAAPVHVEWSALGITVSVDSRDLWEHRDLGNTGHGLSANLPAHGTKFIRIRTGAAHSEERN